MCARDRLHNPGAVCGQCDLEVDGVARECTDILRAQAWSGPGRLLATNAELGHRLVETRRHQRVDVRVAAPAQQHDVRWLVAQPTQGPVGDRPDEQRHGGDQGQESGSGSPLEAPVALPADRLVRLLLAATLDAGVDEVAFGRGELQRSALNPRLEFGQPTSREQVVGIPIR